MTQIKILVGVLIGSIILVGVVAYIPQIQDPYDLGYPTVTQSADYAVQDGDTVIIDYTGRLASTGEEFDGGAATNSPLTIGSGTFIPGFEEQIIGHETGETFDVEVTFPEDYQSTDLAGQDAIFEVTIHEVVSPK